MGLGFMVQGYNRKKLVLLERVKRVQGSTYEKYNSRSKMYFQCTNVLLMRSFCPIWWWGVLFWTAWQYSTKKRKQEHVIAEPIQTFQLLPDEESGIIFILFRLFGNRWVHILLNHMILFLKINSFVLSFSWLIAWSKLWQLKRRRICCQQ